MNISETRKEAARLGLAYRFLTADGSTRFLPLDVLAARIAHARSGDGEGVLAAWRLGDGAARADAAPGEAESAGAAIAGPGDDEPGDELEAAPAVPAAIVTVAVPPASNGLSHRADRLAQALREALGDQAPAALDADAVRALVAPMIAEGLASMPARVHRWVDAAGLQVAQLDGVTHRMLADVVQALQVAPPVLLVGPAGTGKTTLLRDAARALGRDSTEVCCSAATSEAQLLGTVRPDETGAWRFVPGPVVSAAESGALLILDEIDGADPNVGVALHQALDERARSIFVPALGRSIVKADGFVAGACANTYGRGADATYVGRNALDAATLNRFAGSVLFVDYDVDLEKGLAPGDVLDLCWKVREAVLAHGLRRVVSTRDIDRLGRYRRAKLSLSACKARLLTGWSRSDLDRLPAGVRP